MGRLRVPRLKGGDKSDGNSVVVTFKPRTWPAKNGRNLDAKIMKKSLDEASGRKVTKQYDLGTDPENNLKKEVRFLAS